MNKTNLEQILQQLVTECRNHTKQDVELEVKIPSSVLYEYIAQFSHSPDLRTLITGNKIDLSPIVALHLEGGVVKFKLPTDEELTIEANARS